MLQEAAFLDPRYKNLAFLSQGENIDTIERLKLKMNCNIYPNMSLQVKKMWSLPASV